MTMQRVHGRGASKAPTHRPAARGGEGRSLALKARSPVSARASSAKSEPRPGASSERPRVLGKMIRVGEQVLYLRGVTYGAFKADKNGNEYTDIAQIDRDFAKMAENGINAVRIPHTTPPRHLLDIAATHGLWVMVGLSAEQYLGYLVDRRKEIDIDALVRERVRRCAGHPSLLCYSLGNEISPTVARWYGHERVERYLGRLARLVRKMDPAGLVTYVNFPTTEYLDLPFLDFLCFNVYLEQAETLAAYIDHLHTVAGERPLALSEVGLDSLRHGERAQASSLSRQIETSFGRGACGVFVFAWTDEWYRGENPVDDWCFGITDRLRRSKPALAAVRAGFTRAPDPEGMRWPRISVVVCSRNGVRTIGECLDHLERQEYPDYEIIVVDDGSTDRTAEIARKHTCTVITTENRGLSSARNTGAQAAGGQIVAYIDDDAYPDANWLRYLAVAFREQGAAAVGGPNLPPPGDGFVAGCVANAPGGPTHVLITDRVAEHLPGCNLAVRRECLLSVGGFDPQFRVAGDDVDLCWRLIDNGGRILFHPAATVWHHRRGSIAAYWRQQRGYGKAERLLMGKWPQRYNEAGGLSWSGRIYGRGLSLPIGRSRDRIYHGRWGSAPFQRIYAAPPSALDSIALCPEWYLFLPLLGLVALLGLVWQPLLFALVPLALMAGTTLAQAWRSSGRSPLSGSAEPGRRTMRRIGSRLITSLLYVIHPIARLRGRLTRVPGKKVKRLTRPGAARPAALLPLGKPGAQSTPGSPQMPGGVIRRERIRRGFFPLSARVSLWSEKPEPLEERLRSIEKHLATAGFPARRGSDWDRWDLEAGAGRYGGIRLTCAVEDFGDSGQLVRWRLDPRVGRSIPVTALSLVLLAVAAAISAASPAAVVLAAVGLGLAGVQAARLAAASRAVRSVIET